MEMPWSCNICRRRRFAIRIGGETGGTPPTFTTLGVKVTADTKKKRKEKNI